jgi:hypothetical protein
MSKALAPIEVLAPATREQAEKAASLLLTLQRMEKELITRLKNWVRNNGPIQVGDMVYGPIHVATYELDPQLIATTLLQAGLRKEEIWSLFSVNKTNLERGLRKLRRKEFIDLALSSGTQKISERIEFIKTRDKEAP